MPSLKDIRGRIGSVRNIAHRYLQSSGYCSGIYTHIRRGTDEVWPA